MIGARDAAHGPTPEIVIAPGPPPPPTPGGNPTPPNLPPGTPACNLSEDLGSVARGGAPVKYTATFTNYGTLAITFEGITIQSETADRWSVDQTNLKVALQPGKSVTFTVTFTPPKT